MTRAVQDAWLRFWFRPVPTSTLAVVRVGFGAVTFAWALSLAPDLMTFFSPAGALPAQPSPPPSFFPGSPGLLGVLEGEGWVVALYALLLVASACLLVGFHTRPAAVIVFVAILSFFRRNPFLFNSGDVLLVNLAFYLMFAPAGASLSADRWRRFKGRFWEFPSRAPWALRLIQLQLGVMYFTTVWAKMRGTTWNDGTAVSYALRREDLSLLRVPSGIEESLFASNLLTFGTLGTELALAILVWNRRARPWVVGLGILMHVAIALTIMIGFFTLVVLAAYLAFIPPETATRFIRRCFRRLESSRLGPVRRLAARAPWEGLGEGLPAGGAAGERREPAAAGEA